MRVCRMLLMGCAVTGPACAQGGPGAVSKLKLPGGTVGANVPLSQRERAVQALNRFTYGARPGDVEKVLALGTEKWLEQQMTPETIPDAAVERRLNDLPTVRMSAEQALTIFPDRGMVQQVAEGKRPYPADPLLASVYQVQVHKFEAEKVSKASPATAEPTDEEKAAKKKADQATAARIAGELFALPKKERMAALNAETVEDRIAFANNVANDQRTLLLADFASRERETLLAMQGGVGAQYRIGEELSQAHVLREILSERQLSEVMTDFWFNHFNVYMPKDSDQWYTPTYEREAIRPHALGKFRDLLLATARSPAMMVYLDNWTSIGPDSPANGVDPKKPNSKKGNKGLNENYGREVMELHTLGVNGGYTQADVTKLAAILTGWSVDKPGQAGPFQFDPKKHEPGTKEWFGYSIDEQGNVVDTRAGLAPGRGPVPAISFDAGTPDGMKQGVAALTLLAAAPQTAHFISYLLAQRFMADEPPAGLVDRMAKSYLASDGEIKALLRTLVASPEFNSRRYFRNKVKTPQEFLASAFRATATEPQNAQAIVGKLREFGELPYQKLEPTGYYITADHWMNTVALVDRLNFADQLTHNKFANQKFDSSHVLAFGLMADRELGASPAGAQAAKGKKVKAVAVSVADPSAGNMGADVALHVLEGTLIGGPVSVSTDKFIHSQMAGSAAAGPVDTLNLLTALLIGSPEFQGR